MELDEPPPPTAPAAPAPLDVPAPGRKRKRAVRSPKAPKAPKPDEAVEAVKAVDEPPPPAAAHTDPTHNVGRIVVGTVDTGVIVRGPDVDAACKAARAAAITIKPAPAWAHVATWLSCKDVSALALTCKAAHVGVGCVWAPRQPPHALNRDASLVVRRLAALEHAAGDVLNAGGGFSVRALHPRRLAYMAALCAVAQFVWHSRAIIPLPPPLARFVQAFWGDHVNDACDDAALGRRAVASRLLAQAVKPVPAARIRGWLGAYIMTAKSDVLATPSKPKARILRIVDEPWLVHVVRGRAVVAAADRRYGAWWRLAPAKPTTPAAALPLARNR